MRKVLAQLRQRMIARRSSDRPASIRPLDADRAPQFEALEPRNLLSGNVVGVVVGDTLFLTGDNLPNRIEVTDGGGGAISVDAYSADASPTTINGGAGPVLFGGVTNIIVKLNGDNDELYFDTVTIPGNVTVIDNKGLDDVFLLDTAVGGNVNIKLGKDADYVQLSGTTTVTGNLKINTGGGNDAVFFHTEAGGAGPVNVVGWTKIITGGGDDNVHHYAEAGSGFALLQILTGIGDDQVTLDGLTTSVGPKVVTGSGDDLLQMLGGDIFGKSKFNLGGGADKATVTNVTFDDDLRFGTGSGTDEATFIGNITWERFDVNMGTGDEDLLAVVYEDSDMTQQAFSAAARFTGGPGDDDEIDIEDAPIFSNQPVIKAFEVGVD